MTARFVQSFRPRRLAPLRLRASCALFLALVLAVWWFVYAHWDEVAHLRLVKPYWIVPMLVGFGVSSLLQALGLQSMLRTFALSMPWREALHLSNATTMLNFLLPAQGGMGLRGAYLIKAYQCPITDFLSMSGALALLSIFVNTGLGFLALLWITATGGPFHPFMASCMLFLLVATGGGMFLLPKMRCWQHTPHARLSRLITGWHTMMAARHERRLMLGTIVGQSLAAALGYYAAFMAFALPCDPASALVLLAATTAGGLVNLTPGPLGLQELAGMSFAAILPTSSAEILVVLSAYKLMWVLAALGLGLPGLVALRWHTRAQGA